MLSPECTVRPFISRILAGRGGLNRLFAFSYRRCGAALLLLLLGLGSCKQGPETACLTPQTTCQLDKAYAQSGTACHCGDSQGVAVTR
jgi:hypothetical protein